MTLLVVSRIFYFEFFVRSIATLANYVALLPVRTLFDIYNPNQSDSNILRLDAIIEDYRYKILKVLSQVRTSASVSSLAVSTSAWAKPVSTSKL